MVHAIPVAKCIVPTTGQDLKELPRTSATQIAVLSAPLLRTKNSRYLEHPKSGCSTVLRNTYVRSPLRTIERSGPSGYISKAASPKFRSRFPPQDIETSRPISSHQVTISSQNATMAKSDTHWSSNRSDPSDTNTDTNNFDKFKFNFGKTHSVASGADYSGYPADDENSSTISSVSDTDSVGTFVLPDDVLEEFEDMRHYFEDPPNNNVNFAPQVHVQEQVRTFPPQANAPKQTLDLASYIADQISEWSYVFMFGLIILIFLLILFGTIFLNPYPLHLWVVDNLTPQSIPVEDPASLHAEYVANADRLLDSVPSSQASVWYFGTDESVQSLCSVGEELEHAWTGTVIEAMAQGVNVSEWVRRKSVDFLEVRGLCHDVKMGLNVDLPRLVDRFSENTVYASHAIKSAHWYSPDMLSTRSEREAFEHLASQLSSSPLTSSTHQLKSDLSKLSNSLSQLHRNLNRLITLSKQLILEERISITLTAPPFFLRLYQTNVLDRLDEVIWREKGAVERLQQRLIRKKEDVDGFLRIWEETRRREGKIRTRVARQQKRLRWMSEKVSQR